MRISDWSSDVCSSDLLRLLEFVPRHDVVRSSPAYENLLSRKGTCRQSIVLDGKAAANHDKARIGFWRLDQQIGRHGGAVAEATQPRSSAPRVGCDPIPYLRSEEHTSELQSLMRISYAVFCLKKKNTLTKIHTK